MQKMLAVLVACLLCFGEVAAYADDPDQYKVGDAVGHIYGTDITTYLNKLKIPSYNIGGRTVIIIEDLSRYGFDVTWNAEQRTISALAKTLPKTAQSYSPFKKGKPGAVIGTVYYTDINVYINGFLVSKDHTFNLGGKTAVEVEELGKWDNPLYTSEDHVQKCLGWSDYLFQIKWDEKARRLDATTLQAGDTIAASVGDMKIDSIQYYANYVRESGDADYHNRKGITNEELDAMESIFYLKLGTYERPAPAQRYYSVTNLLDTVDMGYTFANNTLTPLRTKAVKKTFIDYDLASSGGFKYNLPSASSLLWVTFRSSLHPEKDVKGLVYRGDLFASLPDISESTGVLYFYDGEGIMTFSVE